MPKILKAHGQAGNHGAHWNWCTEGEVIHIDSMCCGNRRCGCTRSFIGIASRRATTQGVVAEVSDTEFRALCKELYASILRSWGIESVAKVEVRSFNRTAKKLAKLDIGSIVAADQSSFIAKS